MNATINTLLLLPLFIILPFFILWLEKKSRVVQWISPIIICYLIGILIGNIPGLELQQEIQELVYGISVYLAIPLLLFSANFFKMLKQVKPALLSFFLGILAVIITSTLAFLIFREQLVQPNAVSGMMIGVYTGGTPNMSAIGMALKVNPEVFVLLNSADIVFSGIYFIFLLTVGKRLLSLFLPSFKSISNNHTVVNPVGKELENSSAGVKHVIIGLSLAIGVLVVSMGISYLVTPDPAGLTDISIPVLILGITTLGIVASFYPKIQQLPGTYASANYLLLVFALAMGSMANFTELFAASTTLFYFCGFVVFGSVILHFLLAFIFRNDRDTVIIASTAAIFGPAFIGPVANVIGNRDIIATGITLGLIGYAMGNYLGLGLSSLLNLFL
ncbi:MAG: DUF819 family protein [Bacteroidota bacterium]